MPFLQLDDETKIHYLHKGKGDNKILFIHGNLANTIWWESTLDRLPEGYEGFALDLPGSGQSPETGQRHTMAYFADVVYRFTEKLGLTYFHLVGHSMGGMVSQLFTLEHPEKVSKLVLLDSGSADGFHTLYNSGRQKWERMMSDRHFLDYAIKAIAPMCKDEAFLDRVCEAAANASPQVFLEQPVTMREINWMDRLAEIKCPVLFLHGDQDNFVPKEGSEKTASAIPGCLFRYLKNCGHTPMAEVFEDYFQQLVEFLEL